MMCCVIAAFLFAQAMAVLRRWGIYWGVVRAGAGEEDLPTLLGALRRIFARPAVRVAIVAIAVVEIGGVATWLYVDHGDHIAGIVGSTLAPAATARTDAVKICGDGDGTTLVTLAQLEAGLPLQYRPARP
ncbi:hypothetical protein U8326_08995 [Tsuneonella sp. CC-YZS046]|uniref:hypothetical protein n=1 Tax=Tsuneonella sp. CC-YZS046 TaxID=3042152 RepID=UPI002D79B98F|nr:hypothetical protein [Tsuneonella sp. CC-YZS046]WRO65213.1 hypothetical protein U8326_08995 [Tsuneonella sp. CC-YZS046]